MKKIELGQKDLLTNIQFMQKEAEEQRELLAMVDAIELDEAVHQNSKTVLIETQQLQVIRDYLVFGYGKVHGKIHIFGINPMRRDRATENLFRAVVAKYLGCCINQE